MKNTLRIISVITAVALLVSLCACGNNGSGQQNSFNAGTLIYGGTDLSQYVKLGEYKGLQIDTASDEFNAAYEAVVQKDISSNGIAEKKLEGTVQDGDVANIDYVGKKDGVAFDGGTAQGYDLTIGSHTFITGFEEGLVGVRIGDTVDLDLTFPENYGNADLAGAAVVFTVKVNYVKSSSAVDVSDHYSELGYGSFEAYQTDTKKRAAQNLLFERVLSGSEIKDGTDTDMNTFIGAVYEYYDNYYVSNYNMDFATVLTNNGMTKDDFYSQMKTSAQSQVEDQMVYYAILQKEGLGTDYSLSESEATGQAVLDEIKKVEHIVRDYLYDNAVITE
ncbi:MAG: FKBP-type peptidyl-prolyl cis-trans isomerase [Clostridia bacterium]|nr:FKBP-type peptidyl-prolyl cis-trans isomerase [Clostridia bacterium]